MELNKIFYYSALLYNHWPIRVLCTESNYELFTAKSGSSCWRQHYSSAHSLQQKKFGRKLTAYGHLACSLEHTVCLLLKKVRIIQLKGLTSCSFSFRHMRNDTFSNSFFYFAVTREGSRYTFSI